MLTDPYVGLRIRVTPKLIFTPNSTSCPQIASLSSTETSTPSPSTTGSSSPTVTPSRTPTATATGWAIVGSAFWSDPLFGEGQLPILLTDSAANRAGAAWWPGKVYVDQFVATFRFSLEQLASNNLIADGLAFVLHNDPRGVDAIGTSGGNCGYGGTPAGVANSSAVRFDT